MKALILSLLFLVSCGDSPLLNHKMEKNPFTKGTMFSESEALSFKKANFDFIISWVEGPHMGSSHFVMKTWNKNLGTMNGPYQDLPNNLFVFLWMPAMGHGSAPVKLNRINDGEYDVSEVQFIMGGKWEIKFQL